MATKYSSFHRDLKPHLIKGLESICIAGTLYRVVKRNCQVVKLHGFELLNENMVQNSSPTCQHNLFTLIQIKKNVFKVPSHVEIFKKAEGVRFTLCQQ